MSFCTACGNNVDPASKFCDKCGKPMGAMPAAGGTGTAAAAAPAQGAPPQQPQKSGGALKIVLAIFGILLLLFVIGVAGVVGFGLYVAKHAKVEQGANGSAKIETPFGKIEASDPSEVASKMGIDVYPGAEAVKNGAGGVSFGEFSVGSAQFETTDSPDQVADFYKQQYPGAIHTESSGNHVFSIKRGDKNVVINVTQQGSKTEINLAQVVAPNTSR